MQQRSLWLRIQGKLKDKCIVQPAAKRKNLQQPALTAHPAAHPASIKHYLHFFVPEVLASNVTPVSQVAEFDNTKSDVHFTSTASTAMVHFDTKQNSAPTVSGSGAVADPFLGCSMICSFRHKRGNQSYTAEVNFERLQASLGGAPRQNLTSHYCNSMICILRGHARMLE